MRLSGLVGFCILSLASYTLVGCDDREDALTGSAGKDGGGGSGTAGKASSGGKGGMPGTAGSLATGGDNPEGGTFSTAGNAGTFSTAGTAENGGEATAGSGGTGVAPNCTTNAQCADVNDCTDDTCVNGECVHTNNTAACDDANACTSDDACKDGACKGTNNTVACDDGNPCTSDDACKDGACAPGTNNTIACDDLSSCTTDDKCGAGVCDGTKDAVACPSCADASNLILNCDFSDGTNHWLEGWFGGTGTQAVVNQRLVVDITGGGVNVYDVQPRQEMLSLKHGMKYKLRMVVGSSVDRQIVVALTQAVAPYKVHSTGDNAAGGFTLNLTKQMKFFEHEFTMNDPDDAMVKLELKLGGAAGNPSTVYFDDMYVAEEKCADNIGCDDSNTCTDDVCDVGTGICSWTNNTAACTDDTNPCTTDVCAAGACTHPSVANDVACTDDANACTKDVCTAGTCTHPSVADDDPCADDGDNCTADVCTSGACTHAFDGNVCACQQNIQCDDNNPCTDDTCNAGACENVDNALACDDGNVCTTGSVCGAGMCGTNNTDACDDGDPCTVTDVCAAGACTAGTNVCYDCTLGGNLITNCDLSAGTTSWVNGFFDGAAGTQIVQDGMLAINITNAGPNNYDVQPRQVGVALVKDTTYVVKFNAMASVARGLTTSITQDGGGFTSYSGGQNFNLTTQMQLFSFEFTMTADPPAEKVKFEFDLGAGPNNPTVPNTVYLDNLSIAPKP